MSRSLLLRTAPKLFTLPTTHHALRCLLAPRSTFTPISHLTAFLPHGHSRPKSTTRRVPYRKHIVLNHDRLHSRQINLSSTALRELRAIGLDRDQAQNLLRVTRTLALERRGVGIAYDFVRNRETWLQNQRSIPQTYQSFWTTTRMLASDNVEMSGDIADIGPHSDQVIGEACCVIALEILSVGETNKDINYMSWGCFMLQLAVLFRDCHAAACLLNYYNDPIRAAMLAQADLQTSTQQAEVLIRESVTQRPGDTPPAAMLAYLRDEYSSSKITLQNPKQLQWGYNISERIPVESLSFVEDTEPWDVCAHPAQIKLQILDHCLSRNIPLPNLPLDNMLETRDLVLVELTAINDPKASIILAVREDGPVDVFSPNWETLLLSASAAGYPHACWLLSIYYLRKEGIFPFEEKAYERLESSLGLEFGRICILAFLDNESYFVQVTVAYAALCRDSGDYSRGLSILRETLAFVEENPDLPRSYRNTLQDHIYDYTTKDRNWAGRWDHESIEKALQLLDPDIALKATRTWLRKMNWLPSPPQSSSVQPKD